MPRRFDWRSRDRAPSLLSNPGLHSARGEPVESGIATVRHCVHARLGNLVILLAGSAADPHGAHLLTADHHPNRAQRCEEATVASGRKGADEGGGGLAELCDLGPHAVETDASVRLAVGDLNG